MDIYTKKSRWKLYLFLVAMLILAISTIYTNYITTQLADEVRSKVDLYSKTFEKIKTMSLEDDVTYEYQVLESVSRDIPIILVNEKGRIHESINFPDGTDLEKALQKMKDGTIPPIESNGYARYIYYQHPRLLTLLTNFPVLQILFFGIFAGIGYLLFSSARKSEQNLVWVGMAKETAHQLGTPISGIVGWIDHLKIMYPDDEDLGDILDELGNDANRLNLIADRFSKIGSAPKLDPKNIYEELDECRQYMQKRASRRVEFDFPAPDKNLTVNINSHLFAWVIENLLRNALDAMEGKGKIAATVTEGPDFINIDISDTGKGIPSNKLKTVFEPGFTTKKRGWGLGLSLTKRIIESYHSGRIFVKKSVIGEGTTFTIKLPKG